MGNVAAQVRLVYAMLSEVSTATIEQKT